MASNFFKDIGDGLADFVAWLKETLEDEAIRKSIAEDLGLEPGQSLGKPSDQALGSVDRYRSQANPDKEAVIALANDAYALVRSVLSPISAFRSGVASGLDATVYALFDMLLSNYVRLYLPRVYSIVNALGALVEDSSALNDDPFAIKRFTFTLGRVIKLAVSPLYYPFEALKSGVENDKRAQKMSDHIFPELATLLILGDEIGSGLEGVKGFKRLGAVLKAVKTHDVIYGWDPFIRPDQLHSFTGLPLSATPIADSISTRMFTVSFPFAQTPTPTSSLDKSLSFTLAIVPKTEIVPKTDGDKPGLFIGVSGDGKIEVPLSDRWTFLAQASAKPAFSLLLGSEAWDLSLHGQGPTDLPLNVALVSTPDETDVTYTFPKGDSTRIEVGQLSIGFNFDGRHGGIKAQALRCALVIATKDQDGFLSKFLPAGGLRVPFSFGLGFSTEDGFFKEGSVEFPTGPSGGSSPGTSSTSSQLGGPVTAPTPATALAPTRSPRTATRPPELGTQHVISIGKSLGGLKFNELVLGLAPAPDPATGAVKAEVSVSIALKLGPVTVSVERIGFEVGLAFPESGGNAGFADFSIGFKPPTGAGIKIDSGVVAGGGFLSFDREKGQYAGVVQLNIHDSKTLTGIGVITTRLSSGAKGFSFVVMITAEGFNIPLGLGFKLTAIGGIFAFNRTCNQDFLREGIKNKTLDHLLFPKDPIRNGAQIFSTLNNAFPPQEGSHVFAPVVQIRWRSFLTMNLGVVIETRKGPKLTRIVIMGTVLAVLPSEKLDLIRLQMNALGVIDLDQNFISLDAVLYDSRLAGKFPITGSMAMRLRWGSKPEFALSIGGFHPAFKPPPAFPTLERLAISFASSEDFRLRAETYFAITSNTLQYGSKIELFAKAKGFSIEGQYGYDILIQFNPFGFIADFYASMQLKRGSRNLFKVSLEGQLSGPRPLHIKGKATFEILWCDFSVDIDRTLISGEPPPKLAPVVVTSQLTSALSDPQSWTGQLAAGDRNAVALREARNPDIIRVHPLGRLSVSQTVVPLDLEIAKFGNTAPADGHIFRISKVQVNGAEVRFDRVKDFFAPDQFLDLSDDERLRAPSFEQMGAGISVGVGGLVFTDNENDILEYDTIDYETRLVDIGREQSTKVLGLPPLSTEELQMQLSLGAASRNQVQRTGISRFQAAGAGNSLAKRGWTIASTSDGSLQAAPGHEAGTIASYAESFQAMQRARREDPSRTRELMLVRVASK